MTATRGVGGDRPLGRPALPARPDEDRRPRGPTRRQVTQTALLGMLAAAGCAPTTLPRSATAVPTAAGAPTDETYHEQWRPQVHYSPPEGPLADPNGLVWDAGEWHLFHQQDGTWAHAVSSDLVHWTTLPTALEHDDLGLAMSGSAVVDGRNTSGLFGDDGAGLVALYTSTTGGEAQSVAFSTDAGRTFTRFPGNPVRPNEGRRDFRDPKVFWHEPTARWVMVVSVGDAIEIAGSEDLLQWSHLSSFGAGVGLHSAVWECPDLFPLPVSTSDGESTGEVRWVMAVSVGDADETGGSTAQYFVGDFDGITFDASGNGGQGTITDPGQDFYAAQSYENAPDGRRVWLAWMGNWRYPYSTPTVGWSNAMTLPRDLGLRQVGDPAAGATRLVQTPVPELEQLRGVPLVDDAVVIELDRPLPPVPAPYEVLLDIELGDATEVGVRTHELRDADGGVTQATFVGLDREAATVILDRTAGGLSSIADRTDAQVPFGVRRSGPWQPSDDGTVRLRLYVDVASVEVFVDDGVQVGTLLTFPEPADGLSLYSVGGTAQARCTVYPLTSIWP